MIVLVIVLLFFCILLGVFCQRLHKRLNSLTVMGLEQQRQMTAVSREIKALLSADILFGKSVTELNQQLISLDAKLEQLTSHRSNDGGYQHALRILDMGGSKDEIIDSCHLSNAEAELLINLHAYRSAVNP